MFPLPPTLRPAIETILRSSDLSSISAKRIRAQLIALNDPTFPEGFVKSRKGDIDALIMEVFEEVNEAADGADASSEEEPLRQREAAPTSSPSSPKKPKKKPSSTSTSKSDEAYARELSAQLNATGRSSRHSSSTASGSSSRKRGSSGKVKSSERIVDSGEEDEGEGEGEGEDEPPKKKRGGGGGAFNKPFALSDALQVVCGTDQLSRPKVVKAIWDHIKANELQDPSDRRKILCDDKLKAVFGQGSVTMFSMNKFIGKHLYPLDE